jgi:dipeptidase
MNQRIGFRIAQASAFIFIALLMYFAGTQIVIQGQVSAQGSSVKPHISHLRGSDRPLRDKCTSIIVPKDLTADGSEILAHNEDLYNYCAHHYFYTHHATHHAGEIVTTFYGAKVPQVTETYAYTGTTIFDISYSPGAITSGINEHQVAVVNNMSYRRDPEDVSQAGRIIWTEFTKFALERAKTASEAVEVIGGLASKYKLGADTGGIFGVVDKNEGWWVEVTQEGQWAAEKVTSGTVGSRANIFRIGDIDFGSPNFKYSDDLVSYAVSKGWYDSKDTFNFTKTYADPEKVGNTYNTRRTERIEEMLKDSIVAGNIDPKLIISVWRDHYEGTEYDLTFGHMQGSPHNTDERTLCRLDTEVSVVMQARDWLPDEIGAISWRAMATPCMSFYVPWYLAQQQIPDEYKTGGSQFTKKSAYWVARNLSRVADMHYNKTVFGKVGYAQADFEGKEFAEQSYVEKKALSLYNRNPMGARAYLTKYTSDLARKASAKLDGLAKIVGEK